MSGRRSVRWTTVDGHPYGMPIKLHATRYPSYQALDAARAADVPAMCDRSLCREVADRLRRPVWMPQQHRLWPAAYKAAVAELLRCLHSIDRRLAGHVAGGNTGGTLQHPLLSAPAAGCNAAQL